MTKKDFCYISMLAFMAMLILGLFSNKACPCSYNKTPAHQVHESKREIEIYLIGMPKNDKGKHDRESRDVNHENYKPTVMIYRIFLNEPWMSKQRKKCGSNSRRSNYYATYGSYDFMVFDSHNFFTLMPHQ